MLLKNSDKSMISRCIFCLWRRGWLPVGRFCQQGGVSVGCATDLRGVGGFEGFCSMGVCLSLGLEYDRMASCRILLTNQGKVRQGPFCPNDGTKTAFLLLPCSSVRRRVGLFVPRAFPPLSLDGSDYPNLIIKNR